MRDLLLWTWVIGGTPLALALIQRVLEWALDPIGAGMIAWERESHRRCR